MVGPRHGRSAGYPGGRATMENEHLLRRNREVLDAFAGCVGVPVGDRMVLLRSEWASVDDHAEHPMASDVMGCGRGEIEGFLGSPLPDSIRTDIENFPVGHFPVLQIIKYWELEIAPEGP